MGPWPWFLQPQKFERDEEATEKECINLSNVRSRGYVRMGEVKSLNHYLLVTNGEYTSMVYNGT